MFCCKGRHLLSSILFHLPLFSLLLLFCVFAPSTENLWVSERDDSLFLLKTEAPPPSVITENAAASI